MIFRSLIILIIFIPSFNIYSFKTAILFLIILTFSKVDEIDS